MSSLATARLSDAVPAIVKSGLPSSVLMDIEAQAIVAAYQSLKKHGLEFGRLCYTFRERTKRPDGFRVSSETQNSFDSTLDKLDIPRATAYRWIARYEEHVGKRELKPKPHDTPEPSEEVVEPTTKPTQPIVRTYPREDYEPEQQVKAAASRSHGMGLERLRKLAEQRDVSCKVSHDGEAFRLNFRFTTEKEATHFLKSLV
jgi:hypothetical protein